jgi:uncharacterized protein (TIGR02186 family)
VRLLAALLWLAALFGPAQTEELVSTLSDGEIEITSNFTGSRIVVFGAVLDPTPGAAYEVAVVVQGPPQDLVARRKDRVLGVWINREAEEFFHVPSYYVVHLSENYDLAAAPEQRARYRLGLANLPFVRNAYTPDAAAFAQALIGIQSERGLFVARRDAIEFLASNVFRTTFYLPATIPTGLYHVSVYVFRRGALLAAEVQSLVIEKSGYSDRIARFAQDQPLAYGLVTVALAMMTGWIASIVFRRG